MSERYHCKREEEYKIKHHFYQLDVAKKKKASIFQIACIYDYLQHPYSAIYSNAQS